ncbi:MAG TPA: cyclase family protein [Longimicrobium sp.]|nr:cyclase family protein [Longimicrobium sp.]
MSGVLYDISRPVVSGMPVWPGDAPCRVGWTGRLAVDGANVAELGLSAHTGTHADGPHHLFDEGARIGAVPLDAFLGPARVVEARARQVLDAAWAADVLAVGAPERLLVRTGAWVDANDFPTRYAALDADAARTLVDAGVRLFGTDAPCVEAFDAAELPVHRILLAGGMAVLENLLLDTVPEGDYELIALPLRLEEADSSPVRAVLRGM